MQRSVLIIFFSAMVGSAAPAAIGILSAAGSVTIDHSPVWGNATVFEGTLVETSNASGSVALSNGVRIQLGAKSRVSLSEKKMRLDSGTGQVTAAAPFEVDARSLRIRADQGARMVVAYTADHELEISAVRGRVQVANQAGVALASIPAGRDIVLALQDTGANTVARTGCLLYKDGHFILQDEATSEVVELNGSGLRDNVGNRVRVTGAAGSAKPPAGIATSVMNVSQMSLESTGGCLSVASALGAQSNPPAAGTPAPATPQGSAGAPASGGGGRGLSTGAKAAIIIGVAGGAGAGAAVALAGKKSTSP